MEREERNPAKIIGAVATVFVLIFLFVAVESKAIRVLIALILILMSFGFMTLKMLEFRRKKSSLKVLSNPQKISEFEEGFIIKNQNQNTSASPKLNPREEFKSLLEQLLHIIKANIFSSSVAFYWVNEDKKQFVFESGVTDLSSQFVKRYNWGNDVLTSVVNRGMPRVLHKITSEINGEIARYHTNRTEVKSVIAFPVKYNEKIVGILVLDSREEKTFSDDDLRIVEMYARFISELIDNYNEKFELYHNAKIFDEIYKLNFFDINQIFERVKNVAIKILDCNAVAMVTFDEGKLIVSGSYSRLGKYVELGAEVNPEVSLAGQVAMSGTSKFVSSSKQSKVVRFFDGENIDFDSSIAVVPIKFNLRCYGSIVFEHPKPKFFYSHFDLKKLETFANVIGMLFEIASLNELTERFVHYEEETPLVKASYFKDRLDEEIERLKRFNGMLTLALIKIDNYSSIAERFGAEACEYAISTIAKIVIDSIDRYELAGKLDENLIAVYFVNDDIDFAFSWSEKLRKDISSQELVYNGRTFVVTVTIGILAWDGEQNADAFIERAMKNFLKVTRSSENVVKFLS